METFRVIFDVFIAVVYFIVFATTIYFSFRPRKLMDMSQERVVSYVMLIAAWLLLGNPWHQ